MARTVYEREIDEGHFNFTSLARPPCSPTSSLGHSRKPSSIVQFRIDRRNRPFYLVCFVFPIQTTWCSPGNLPFVISLIMHTYARGCTCIRLHLKKKQFTGVQSRGLKWENKTYKLKRSIRRGRWIKAPKTYLHRVSLDLKWNIHRCLNLSL